jgi:hypothetical protein
MDYKADFGFLNAQNDLIGAERRSNRVLIGNRCFNSQPYTGCIPKEHGNVRRCWRKMQAQLLLRMWIREKQLARAAIRAIKEMIQSRFTNFQLRLATGALLLNWRVARA